jgi:hypothetical protein
VVGDLIDDEIGAGAGGIVHGHRAGAPGVALRQPPSFRLGDGFQLVECHLLLAADLRGRRAQLRRGQSSLGRARIHHALAHTLDGRQYERGIIGGTDGLVVQRIRRPALFRRRCVRRRRIGVPRQCRRRLLGEEQHQ